MPKQSITPKDETAFAVNAEDLAGIKQHKLLKEKRELEEKQKAGAWDGEAADSEYGLCDFMTFCFPFVWKGDCCMKFTTVLTFLMLFASKACQIGHPLVLKRIIEAISCDAKKLAPGDTCPTTHDIYLLIIAFCAVKFAADLINQLREIPFSYIMANAEKHIAGKVFSHVQRQSLSFHLSRETGKIIRIVQKGAHSFAHVFRYMMFNLAPIIVEVAFTVIIIGVLYPYYFSLVVLGTIFIYLIVTVVLTEWRAKHFKVMTKADVEYSQKATDSLLNFETVKYFNAENHEQQRFEGSLLKYKMANITVSKSLVTLNVSQTASIIIGLVGTLMLAWKSIRSEDADSLKVADFVVFNTYILQIYFPLGFLGTFWRFIRQSWTDIELVLDILAVDQSIKEFEDPIEANIHAGEIEFKNVSFTYDADKPKDEQRQVLYNLSFKVPAGKSVALVGATGSGKSTIMRLLYRFYELEQGQILIDGQDICKMRIDDLRSNIAIVPQDCVLFNDTALYNIAYGGVKDKDFKAIVDDEDRVDELTRLVQPAAERAQIHQYIMRKNDQYQTIVGERGLKLSGGEKQRVAISRALLKQTQIMCFDEATSALDTETERLVQQAIDKIARDSTTLMIAHRLSTVRNCDIIIALRHGVIMEQGSHDELLQIPDGYYKSLWEKQAQSKEEYEAELAEKAAFIKELADARAAAADKKLKANQL